MKRFLANLLWLLACLPRWVLFRVALRDPAAAQRRVLARLLRENRNSGFGRRHRFAAIRTPAEFAASVPLADYEDFAPAIEQARATGAFSLASETPLLLEPTSGTSGSSKLIPATRASRREFVRAIQPWIADLFLAHPSLLLGRQYWVVSPATPLPESLRGGAIRVGFAADAEYLGPLGRFAARHVLAPSLQGDPNLRLISLWHPSYLAAETNGFKPDSAARWPRLKLISCWTDGNSSLWAEHLRKAFQRVPIQGKGLLATEGCVTIPFRGRHPCAIRSHYLEFIDAETQAVCGVAELEPGHVYSVVLTTGAGLWRYRLHDQVRVDGFLAATPCLAFLGKDNAVSDLVGEKVSEADAAVAIAEAIRKTGALPGYAVLVPSPDPDASACGYDAVIDLAGEDDLVRANVLASFAAAVEASLCATNFHYRHARAIGQLRGVRAVLRRDARHVHAPARLRSGVRSGTLKIPALGESRQSGREPEAGGNT